MGRHSTLALDNSYSRTQQQHGSQPLRPQESCLYVPKLAVEVDNFISVSGGIASRVQEQRLGGGTICEIVYCETGCRHATHTVDVLVPHRCKGG